MVVTTNNNTSPTSVIRPSIFGVYDDNRKTKDKSLRILPTNEIKLANTHPDDLQTRCFGGAGGVPFDNGNRNGRITRISVRSDNTINQLSMTYALGKRTLTCHHGGMGGPGVQTQSLDLHTGEYVTEVHILYDCSRVLQLIFKSELGRILGPCGRETCNQDGGSAWTEVVTAPEGYVLVGVRGMANTVLDCIGFYWGVAPDWRGDYCQLSSSCLMDIDILESEESDDELIHSISLWYIVIYMSSEHVDI